MTRARRPRPGLALLALAAAVLGPAPAAGAPAVEYLYIEANEGGSSGGHVALRLGERVFHFQHSAPGIVALGQASYQSFRHQYADLENRTIQASRIEASEETYVRLVERFTRRQVIQDQQLAALDAIRRDRQTLEAMLDGAAPIEAAGFFFSDTDGPRRARDLTPGDDASAAPAADQEPAILALRSRIEAARGPDFLADRAREISRQLASLDPEALELPAVALSDDRVPPPTYGFVARYVDIAAGLLALEVLGSARRLQEGAAIDDRGDALVLEPGDAAAVRRLADGLEARLVSLVGSSRPDWGPAALLAMARLAALRRTESAGTWTVLGLPSSGGVVGRRRTEPPDIAQAKLGRARASWDSARRRLFDEAARDGFPEAELAALERAANHLSELGRAIAEDRPPRALRGALPSRPARRPLLREVAREVLARDLTLVKAREEAYARGLGLLYAYNVISRNCVTEILLEMQAAAGVGGRTVAGLDFIPAFSPSAVGETYPVAEVVEIPSYRKRRLAGMRERESGAQVFLRESNTITSTLYRRNPEDSVFLFFTDDAIAARPILGAANLLVGAGASIAGLVMLPADGGATLMSGLRGVLFSLPELVFQNIRKGSFDDAVTGE